MDLSLNSAYEELSETLYVALKDAKELTEAQLGRFKDYFALQVESPKLWANGTNLIIGDEATYEEMKAFIKNQRLRRW